MYIQELQLQNFKGFDNIELEFHPELSILVGPNGSGKTSILEGAAIAISTMFVKMDGCSGRSIDKSQAHLKAFLLEVPRMSNRSILCLCRHQRK